MKRRRPSRARRKAKAASQRGYRQRYAAGTIAPNIPVTVRAAEALKRRAIVFDGLTKEQAETASQHREWIVQEVFALLEKHATDWRIE